MYVKKSAIFLQSKAWLNFFFFLFLRNYGLYGVYYLICQLIFWRITQKLSYYRFWRRWSLLISDVCQKYRYANKEGKSKLSECLSELLFVEFRIVGVENVHSLSKKNHIYWINRKLVVKQSKIENTQKK